MLDRIRDQAGRLSPAESRVARWVADHPRQAMSRPLAEVAAASGASEPTVVRFCRHMGLSGFRELRIRLAEAVSAPAAYVHSDVLQDDSVADVLTKVLDRSIQALAALRSRAGQMAVPQAVERMSTARQLVFAGIGASGEVARDACQKFFRLGIPCAAVSDLPTMLQMAAIADAADVFLVTSHTGRRPELARCARVAGRRGATVIALTAPGSELAEAATLTLPCLPEEDTSLYTPMSSRLAQLALLDAMQVALAVRLGPAASERLRASKAVLETANTDDGSIT